MQFKTTTKLFNGIYQYKIVLICAGAQWFRSGDWDNTLTQLQRVTLNKAPSYSSRSIKTKEELDYAFKLHEKLSAMDDIEVRIESPWISVYTNSKDNVDTLIKIDKNLVKYVSMPPENISLSEDTIIMPKVNFEFRITLAKTTKEHKTFVEWAKQNSKLKLTKSCIRALEQNRSWGGTHFYVTGEKNLLMTRMHLGGSIGKIERIIKA